MMVQARSSIQAGTAPQWRLRLAAVALLGVTLILLWLAARMLLAALFSLQTEAFLEDWRMRDRQPEPAAWSVAQHAAQRAVDLYPVANGEDLLRLGRVYQWRYPDHPVGHPEAIDSRRQAVAAYEAATRARPLRPYDWVRLADAERRLGERDAELSLALSEAHRLGPWRRAINRQVAVTGLKSWHRLDGQARDSTLEAARRAIARGDAAVVREAISSQGLRIFVCARLPSDLPDRAKVCD